MQVWTTVCGKRLRKDGGDRVGEALQPVGDGDQDIGDATGLQFIHDPEPELGTLGLLDPEPEDLPGAVRLNAEREVDRLVADEPLVPDLHPDRVEEDQRIAGVERPVLPFGNFLEHGIGDGRDEIRRDVDPVEFLEMAADLTHRHATGVHRDDLVVELGETPLIPGDQLRIEGPRPIPRYIEGHFGRARQHRLFRATVASVHKPAVALLLQVLVQLAVQNARRQRLLQLVDKAVTAENLLRVAARQELVQDVFLDGHVWVPFFPSSWPPAQNS